MSGRFSCRIGAATLFLMGCWLGAETMLGRPLHFEEGPDSTTGTTVLFLMQLSLWAFLGGEIGALRERVNRLNQAARLASGGLAETGVDPGRPGRLG